MKLFLITTSSHEADSLAYTASDQTNISQSKRKISKFYFDTVFGEHEDDQLGSFLEEDEAVFPAPEILTERLDKVFKVVNENGNIADFTYIKQIPGSNIFFYNRYYGGKSNTNLYLKFLGLLISDVLEQFPKEKVIDLNLVLHQGDNYLLAPPNKKVTIGNQIYDRLLEMLRDDFKSTRITLNIWTFSHDGSGIHGRILRDAAFFDNLNGLTKEDKLFKSLDDLTTHNHFAETDTHNEHDLITAEAGKDLTLPLEDGIFLSTLVTSENLPFKIKEYIDELIAWQLNQIAIGEKTGDFSHLKPIITICETNLENFQIDRRINYLDSSIWLRYTVRKPEETIIQCLERIKKQMIAYGDIDLYSSANAKEYYEFYARMAQNSYLKKFGVNHHNKVSPFVFHSEEKMAQASVKLLRRLNKYERTFKWRFLLVDDHASTQDLSSSKNEIIRKALSPYFQFSEVETSKKFTIEMDYAINIAEAKRMIKTKRYDVILLDYLLGRKGDTGEREYGYELLRDIKDIYAENPEGIDDWQGSKGIYEKFWFFFISAFPHAVTERLLEQGMAYNTDYWEIGRGACPRNTPELFCYNLMNFLCRQIEIISQLPNSAFINEHSPITPFELLAKIYDPEKTHGSPSPRSIREKAGAYFDDLLKMRANYYILKKDRDFNSSIGIDNGSALIKSLFTDIENYDSSFWEHLMHLVYLTAFGIIRQWPELWEEFLYVRPKLSNEINGLIEGYIIGLREGRLK